MCKSMKGTRFKAHGKRIKKQRAFFESVWCLDFLGLVFFNKKAPPLSGAFRFT